MKDNFFFKSVFCLVVFLLPTAAWLLLPIVSSVKLCPHPLTHIRNGTLTSRTLRRPHRQTGKPVCSSRLPPALLDYLCTLGTRELLT